MTLVWEREHWWTDHLASRAEWWRVRRSEDDATMLAYHMTAAHADAGRWTKTKPGRYLTAYTKLSPKEVKFWAEWHIKGQRPAEDDQETAEVVLFATTPDQIEYVYVNGPPSCMSRSASGYDSREHPTRIYGAGDIAIAHMTWRDDDTCEDAYGRKGDKRGYFKARAICWPEKKVFGRIYPDPCYDQGAALQAALLALGYRSAHTVSQAFNGARLLRIEYDDRFVMPYLDNPCQSFDDHGDYLVMSDCGEHNAEYTNGLSGEARDEYENTCDNCEEGFNEDGDRVYTRVNAHGGYREQYWCRHCVEHDTFYCEGFGEQIADGNDHDDWNGGIYSQRWLDDNTFISDFSGNRTDNDDGITMIDGEMWSNEEAEEHAVDLDGEWWPTADALVEMERRAANVDDRNGMLQLSMSEELL